MKKGAVSEYCAPMKKPQITLLMRQAPGHFGSNEKEELYVLEQGRLLAQSPRSVKWAFD
jgi:hypothetical protein